MNDSMPPLTDLSADERAVQRALGASTPPLPKRNDVAFARAVKQAHAPSSVWARFFWLPIPAMVAAAIFLAVPDMGTAPERRTPASGAELLALSLPLLMDDDNADPLLEEPLDEDGVLFAAVGVLGEQLDEDVVFDADIDAALEIVDASGAEDIDSFDDFDDEALLALGTFLEEGAAL